MALIKCPECKKRVSDQCENCPKCGYPLKDNVQYENTETKPSGEITTEKKPFYKKVLVWIAAGVVLIAFVIGAIFLFGGNICRLELGEHIHLSALCFRFLPRLDDDVVGVKRRHALWRAR